MSRLIWCLDQKNGIKIIEPNMNLSQAYIMKAQDSLESIQVNIKKEWKIATAYYSIYFSLLCYSHEDRIKSEIHSCTIEFVKEYLSEFFAKDELEIIEDSLKARIDAQYYIDKDIPDELFYKLVESAPIIFVTCKSIIPKLTEKKINSIREEIKALKSE